MVALCSPLRAPSFSIRTIKERMFHRHIEVVRSRGPKRAMKATGCIVNADGKVLEHVPRLIQVRVPLIFFQINCDGTNDMVDELYGALKLKADPYAAAALVEENRNFTDQHSIAQLWRDDKDRPCFLEITSWPMGRALYIDNTRETWRAGQWLCGVPDGLQ